MAIQTREDITAREQVIHEWEREDFKLQSEHAVTIKKLDIEATKLDSKITAWFKLPLRLIYLPVSLFICLVLFVYAIRGKEPPKSLIELLRQ